MKLQILDGVVRSIMQPRPIFPEMTDVEFTKWYSKRFMVTKTRVWTILGVLKAYE